MKTFVGQGSYMKNDGSNLQKSKNRMHEDREFKKMSKRINYILTYYGYVMDGPMKVINTENGRKKRVY